MTIITLENPVLRDVGPIVDRDPTKAAPVELPAGLRGRSSAHLPGDAGWTAFITGQVIAVSGGLFF